VADERNRGPYTGAWFDQRNRKRKENYHTDETYRANANKAARDGYRKSKGTATPFDPRKNLDRLESFGTIRHVLDAGTEPMLTFSKSELANVFERPAKQLQQWAQSGRIPATKLRGRVVGKERNLIDVYTPDEARAIIETLGPFLSEMIYFRCDHVDAIRAVHEAVEKVRA
jgi:integrase